MNEFSDMIPKASRVKESMNENESYKAEIKAAITSVNNRIESAKKRGDTKTCWSVPYKHENELKRLYQQQGYYFTPTGYIGGVWQLTEDINWG